MGVWTMMSSLVAGVADGAVSAAKLATGALKTKLAAEADGNKLDTSCLAAAAGVTNGQLAGSIAATKLAGSITDSKLSQITTASKVHGSSITGLASLPAGAGVVPIVNLATGAPSGAKFVRDDGVLAAPDVSAVFDSAKGVRSNVADKDLLHGQVTLGAKATTWVGLSAATSGKIFGTADLSGDAVNVEDGTIIANGDAVGAETITFTAGTQGTATSGAALNTGRFLIVLGDNDTLPLVQDSGGPVDVVVAAGLYATGDALATAIANALNADATLTGTYGCLYNETTNKFVFSCSETFAVPWTTADGDEISATIGFTGDDAAAATYTGDVAVFLNVITGANDGFTIAKNGGAGTGCTVAAGNFATLAAVDTAIENALTGGGFTGVGITVAGNKIVCTSTQKGIGSSVLLTAGANDVLRMIDCTAGLVAYVQGTGWAANTVSATRTEIRAHLDTATNWESFSDGNYIGLRSKTAGDSSSLVMGNGTSNATLGFTNADGAQGRASAALEAMADANYSVILSSWAVRGGTSPGAMQVVTEGKSTTQFGIRVTTAASAEVVSFLLMGAGA